MDEELPLEAALNQSWASLCNLKEEIVWTVHRTAASAAIFQRERARALSQKIIIIKDVCSAGAEKFVVLVQRNSESRKRVTTTTTYYYVCDDGKSGRDHRAVEVQRVGAGAALLTG